MIAFTVVASCFLPQDPPPQIEPMPVPLIVACRRGDQAIEVDGSLLDWPQLPALDLSDQRQLSGTGQNAWRGTADLSAVAFLLWDDQDLWFSCVVKDEWHRSLDATSGALHEIPVADSIVLTFDPQRDTRALGPDPGRRDDVEFWLGDESSHGLLLWDRLRGSARICDGGRVVVSHDRESGLTTYEARLPWQEILPPGAKPKAGLVFDLQVVVNDFDESTDSMPQTRIGWTFGCDVAVDPGLLGSVQLIADVGGLQGAMPEFPPRLSPPLPESLGTEIWRRFAAEIAGLPPTVHDGRNAPEEAGGIARLRLLEWYDAQCARFPRVDHVEFCQRIQRRMVREVAGIQQRGLPWFWNQMLMEVSRSAEKPPPNGVLRLYRLPHGGWLLRGAADAALVDPSGAELHQWLWGASQCVVLSQPLDITRRNDQLVVRMATSKSERTFYTHAAFHVPLLTMNDMPLVEPGKQYVNANGIQLRTLGHRSPDGSVPYALGYRIAMPAGPSILVAGPSLSPDDLPEEPSTAMILSPRNPRAISIARKANVELIVLDDVFCCESLPNVRRVALADLHMLQKAILPKASLLLGPGESWDIANTR